MRPSRIAQVLACILFSLFLSAAYADEDLLTWKDCVREAAENNPDLVSAVEGVNQSRANEKITASSLYPQVTGSVAAATAKAGEASDTYAYGVSGSQLVFDGLKTASEVKAAVETTKAARENYRFISSEVRYRLRSAFIDLLKTQESIRVAQEIARIRKENLVLIALKYESGLEHKGALMNAEANLASAKFQVERAKRNVEVAQAQLSKEMGRNEFMPLRAQGDLEGEGAIGEPPDFAALVDTNPSLQRLAAERNAAAFGLTAAKQNFFPVVTAQAGAGKTGGDWPPQEDRWDLGLGLSLPLFEGGLRVAQVSEAQAVLNQVKADERSARDSIIVSLRQTWTEWQNAADFVSVEKKYVDASQERAKIAQAQYSIGMVSYDNWTIIEDELVRAKQALLEAQAAALQAQAAWTLAKGETLAYEE